MNIAELECCFPISTITKEQNENKWAQARSNGIGGSDIGAICGVSPFTSARQIYLAKTGQYTDSLKPNEEATERMYFGTLLEPVVANEYARRSGNKIFDAGCTLARKDTQWALANVDRLIESTSRPDYGILECKTTSEYNADEWDNGDILLSYVYQLNWYFWVTGLQWGAFACLVGGNKFFYYEVFRNDELINDVLIPAATTFWNDNVKKLIEPAMGSVDTEFANSIYAEVVKDSETVFDGEDADLLAHEIVECKASIKAMKEQLESAQNKMKDKLKNIEIGYTRNYVVKWSPRMQRRIDTDLVKRLYPDVYDKCSKTISYRTMTIKGGIVDVTE
jgi:putative phage-type endonuclease